jgi:hypothetical protein
MSILILKLGFIFYFLKIYYHAKLQYKILNQTFSIGIFLKNLFVLNNFNMHVMLPIYISSKKQFEIELIDLERKVKINLYFFLLCITSSFTLGFFEL